MEQGSNFAKVLNAVRQVANNGMHLWASTDLAQMKWCLACISMGDYKMMTCFSFADGELIASASFPSSLIYFFKRDMLMLKKLAREDGSGFDILPFHFDPKSII